jgi:hypothetical protein
VRTGQPRRWCKALTDTMVSPLTSAHAATGVNAGFLGTGADRLSRMRRGPVGALDGSSGATGAMLAIA